MINPILQFAILVDYTFDNTFVGTLFAGLFLAFLSFKFYKYQKSFDFKHNKESEIKELATQQLMYLQIAFEDYNAILDIVEGKNKIAKAILDQVSLKDSNYFYKQYNEKFIKHLKNINDVYQKLRVNLSLREDYKKTCELIEKNLSIVVAYFGLVSLFDKLGPAHINPARVEVEKAFTPLKDAICNLIKDNNLS